MCKVEATKLAMSFNYNDPSATGGAVPVMMFAGGQANLQPPRAEAPPVSWAVAGGHLD